MGIPCGHMRRLTGQWSLNVETRRSNGAVCGEGSGLISGSSKGYNSMRIVKRFVIFVFWHCICAENVLKPVFQFILSNENICGDQFRDPLWLPALDDCQIDCDISSQVCQYRIDNKYPGQRCQRLPRDCMTEIKRILELDIDTPALQLPLAPLTTPTPTMAPFIAPFRPNELDTNSIISPLRPTDSRQRKVLGIPSLPQAPLSVSNNNQNLPYYGGSYDDPTTSGYPQPSNNEYRTAQMSSYYGDYATSTVQPEYTPPEASIRIISYDSAVVPPSYPAVTTTVAPPAYNLREIDNNVIPMSPSAPDPSPDYENERNLEPNQVVPPSKQPDTTDFEFQSTNEVAVPENVNFFGPPNGLENRFQSSTSYPILGSQTHTWHSQAPLQPVYTAPTTPPITDHSARCCQWALDGLCDSSWQRIRKLCPKSCGAVYCSDETGAYTCHRAIEVDAVECFQQRRRLYHARGSKTLHDRYHNRESVLSRSAADITSKRVIYNSAKKPKLMHLESLQPDYARAYAIENEIQSWGFFG
uniref:ShKT domain-containing protein n=2 Tax=Panagrellus redivivus TaxID=6233 RepID=A0A7E4VU15_PANRE